MILWWKELINYYACTHMIISITLKTIPIFISLIFLSWKKGENYGLEFRYQMVWECNSQFIIHPSLDNDHTSLEVFTISLSGVSLKLSSTRIEMRIGMQNSHLHILSTCCLRQSCEGSFLCRKTFIEMTGRLFNY